MLRRELADEPPRNLRLTIEYLGTSFAGWQVQPQARTVMGEVERAIAEITREQVRLVAASRTDAGVHALGQVANFHSSSRLSTKKLHAGLNALLPDDVAIRAVEEAPSEFHARYFARGKHYRYRILNQQTSSPLEAATSWHIPVPLDVEAMALAARSFEGEQDFSALATQRPQEGDSCVRRLLVVRARPLTSQITGASLVTVDVVGDGFLYKMVRTIVGTLALVGEGKHDSKWVGEILRSRERKQAGPTAPPQGLFLKRVFYDGDELPLSRYLERIGREGNDHWPQHAGPRQRQGVRGAEGSEAGALL